MPFDLTLTSALENRIIAELQVAFPDCAEIFSSTPLVPNLRHAMAAFVAAKFNIERLKVFADRYYAKGLYVSKLKKAELELIRLVFATCCVLLLSQLDSVRSDFKPESEANNLFYHYSAMNRAAFATTAEFEIARFVRFRNILKTAALIIPLKLNKQLIVNIACRLQLPAPCIYTWGKSMSAELKRFVVIYHLETGVPVETRKPRNRTNAGCNKDLFMPSKRVASEIVSDSESDAEHDNRSAESSSQVRKRICTGSIEAHIADPTVQYLMLDYQRAQVGSIQQMSLSDMMLRHYVVGDDDNVRDIYLPYTDRQASLSEMLNITYDQNVIEHDSSV